MGGCPDQIRRGVDEGVKPLSCGRRRLIVHDIRHGSAEDVLLAIILCGIAVPENRLVPVLVAELSARLSFTPMVATDAAVKLFGVAIVAARRTAQHPPPRVETTSAVVDAMFLSMQVLQIEN